jgi:2-methylisocitrate lyase-like PEP mutase family enzyme
MSEVVDAARRLTAAIDIPLVVDAGAGFGDPLHLTRAVREFERAGVAAIHVEDQVFPKRAHYHRDYREHTIPAEEMAVKVRFAAQARRDPDFVLIARTDAMRTEGYEEGIRRANLYAEAGADLVMLFPNTAAEAERAPIDCQAHLVYVNSPGNRVGRPVYAIGDLEALGYKIAYDAIGPTITAYNAMRSMLERLRQSGQTGIDPDLAIRTRKAIEDTIGLEEYYRIEEQTVERQ